MVDFCNKKPYSTKQSHPFHPAQTPHMSDHLQGLQTVDWICIGIYACVTIGIGWYFGRRQRSTKEYFVGRGNMNSVLIGISLFVTEPIGRIDPHVYGQLFENAGNCVYDGLWVGEDSAVPNWRGIRIDTNGSRERYYGVAWRRMTDNS